jgi:ATP-dependent Clp protease protease subunit
VKQGQVYIHGVIGSYTDEEGQEVKGVELLDVISQVKSQPQATSFLVHIMGPGGLVDAGNAIYDYLESLKAQGIQVDTITDGDIGSIATKVFLAGTNRTIVDGHEFFIHNPWNQPKPGDAKSQELELAMLKQTEAQLRAFYQQHTNITDTGLKGLMDKQTGMNADQAVTLGFATRKAVGNKIKALSLLKNNSTMSEKITTDSIAKQIADGIKALFKAEGLPGAAPAAAAPAPGGAPDLTGKPVLVDGQPAPDGVYTIAGGMVASVEPVTEEQNEPAAQPGSPNPAAGAAPAQNVAQAQELAALKAELAELKAVDHNAAITKAIEDFKNSLPVGKNPVKAFNNNGGNDTGTYTHKSIAQRTTEKQEEKKKQQFNKK